MFDQSANLSQPLTFSSKVKRINYKINRKLQKKKSLIISIVTIESRSNRDSLRTPIKGARVRVLTQTDPYPWGVN